MVHVIVAILNLAAPVGLEGGLSGIEDGELATLYRRAFEFGLLGSETGFDAIGLGGFTDDGQFGIDHQLRLIKAIIQQGTYAEVGDMDLREGI